MALERIQAPAGGVNSDAAPDAIGATQCVGLDNFLGSIAGKARLRGPINQGVNLLASDETLIAAWMSDDALLFRGSGGTYWRTSTSGLTTADVSFTLTKKPKSSVHARYGDFVFGAIDEAVAPSPALGRWDGGTTNLILETVAPYGFTDVHTFAHRLFVLGGTVPGTTATVLSRVLYWTDPDVGDLGLITSWQDDVSGLVNQIRYDGDDTPVALATCGRSLAIIGTRSINLLSGSGSSNFAITNVSKEYGCTDKRSIVEGSGGFWFMSNRGPCFCDGSSVVEVGQQLSQRWLANGGTVNGAALIGGGYLAMALPDGVIYLLHIQSGGWSTMTSALFSNALKTYVLAGGDFPLAWDGRSFWRLNKVTNPAQLYSDYGDKTLTSVQTAIPASWSTRLARLSEPSTVAVVRRILVDYSAAYIDFGTTPTSAFLLDVYDGHGNLLSTFSLPGLTVPLAFANVGRPNVARSRAVFDLNAEADTICMVLSYVSGPTGSNIYSVEVYDAWIEFDPAQKRGST